MLEYQKCTQTQVLITFTRTAQIYYNIIIYRLTRARDAPKQSAKCTIIPVYQNAYNIE